MIKYVIDDHNFKIIKLSGNVVEEFIQFPGHKVELKPNYFICEDKTKYHLNFLFDSFNDAKTLLTRKLRSQLDNLKDEKDEIDEKLEILNSHLFSLCFLEEEV